MSADQFDPNTTLEQAEANIARHMAFCATAPLHVQGCPYYNPDSDLKGVLAALIADHFRFAPGLGCERCAKSGCRFCRTVLGLPPEEPTRPKMCGHCPSGRAGTDILFKCACGWLSCAPCMTSHNCSDWNKEKS